MQIKSGFSVDMRATRRRISSRAELVGVCGENHRAGPASVVHVLIFVPGVFSAPRVFCAAHLIAPTDFDFLAPASEAFPHERKA